MAAISEIRGIDGTTYTILDGESNKKAYRINLGNTSNTWDAIREKITTIPVNTCATIRISIPAIRFLSGDNTINSEFTGVIKNAFISDQLYIIVGAYDDGTMAVITLERNGEPNTPPEFSEKRFSNDDVIYGDLALLNPYTQITGVSTSSELTTALNNALSTMDARSRKAIWFEPTTDVGPFKANLGYYGDLVKSGSDAYASAIFASTNANNAVLCAKSNGTWTFNALITEKSQTITATTNASTGGINPSVSDDSVIFSITSNGYMIFPYKNSTGKWRALVYNTNMELVKNTEITFTVYYR